MSNSTHKQAAGSDHVFHDSSATTYVRIPAVASTACDITKGHPFKSCERSHLVSVLDGLIESSIRDNYRLSLVLVQIQKKPSLSDNSSSANNVDAHCYSELINILRRSYSPVDIALIYQKNTIALILPGCVMPINVIRENLRRQIAELGSLTGFGMSAVTGASGLYLDAGEMLLSTAESRLKASHRFYM